MIQVSSPTIYTFNAHGQKTRKPNTYKVIKKWQISCTLLIKFGRENQWKKASGKYIDEQVKQMIKKMRD